MRTNCAISDAFVRDCVFAYCASVAQCVHSLSTEHCFRLRNNAISDERVRDCALSTHSVFRPLPLVTMSPLIAHLQPSVTDRHRWSAARRHRQSPLACSCRPITARHCCSVARRHCPSPPACHYLPPHHHPHDTVCHLYHLDGDAELHTGGLTCCRSPAASSAAYL